MIISIESILSQSMKICEGDYIGKTSFDNNERRMSVHREGWKRDVSVVRKHNYKGYSDKLHKFDVSDIYSTNMMQVWKWITLMYKVS